MKILVVDDEQNIRRLISFNLSQKGHEILVARNGKEGLESAQVNQPDLILLDIMMPVMNGFDACQKLKEDPKTKHIPVIVLSAKGQMTDLDEAMRVGADNYITKPFDVEKLNDTLMYKLKNMPAKEKD